MKKRSKKTFEIIVYILGIGAILFTVGAIIYAILK